MKRAIIGALVVSVVATSAEPKKRIEPVVGWGSECFAPYHFGRSKYQVCIGYEFPPGIFAGREDEIELEPLFDKQQTTSKPGGLGGNGSGAGGGQSKNMVGAPPSDVLADLRNRRDAFVDRQLGGSLDGQIVPPNNFGFYHAIVMRTGVKLFATQMDPLASPLCGKGNSPCFACSQLTPLDQMGSNIEPSRLFAATGRASSMAAALVRTALEKKLPGTDEALFQASLAAEALRQTEQAGMARQLRDSRAVNSALNECVAISIEEAISLFERNIVDRRAEPTGSIAEIDADLTTRVNRAQTLVSGGQPVAMVERGFAASDEPRIPLRGDKFDEIAKKANASVAMNPQAIRARGLLGVLVSLGRELEQTGQSEPVARATLEMTRSVADIGLGLVPFVGLGKDVYEAALGTSVLDGSQLTNTERAFAVFGIATLGYGDEALKLLRRAIEKISGTSSASSVLRHFDNIVAMLGHKRATLQATGGAQNVPLPSLDSLRIHLSKQEYSSMIDDAGRLRPETIARLRLIGPVKSQAWSDALTRDGSSLSQWKYYGYGVENYAGRFEGRLYINEQSGGYHLVKTNLGRLGEWLDAKDLRRIE